MIETKLGICMDYSNAQLTEFTRDPMRTTSIDGDFTHQDKLNTLRKSEYTMHKKEQNHQTLFFKKIEQAILPCNEVVLFGPTLAKHELFNLIKEDHRFDKIKIDVEQTDKMTELEQQQFVKHHFSKK